MNLHRTTQSHTPRIRTFLAASTLGLGLLTACGEAPEPAGQAHVPVPTETPATTVALGPVNPDAAERWADDGSTEMVIGPVNPDAAEHWVEQGTDDLAR